jgi:hypothetical protein
LNLRATCLDVIHNTKENLLRLLARWAIRSVTRGLVCNSLQRFAPILSAAAVPESFSFALVLVFWGLYIDSVVRLNYEIVVALIALLFYRFSEPGNLVDLALKLIQYN